MINSAHATGHAFPALDNTAMPIYLVKSWAASVANKISNRSVFVYLDTSVTATCPFALPLAHFKRLTALLIISSFFQSFRNVSLVFDRRFTHHFSTKRILEGDAKRTPFNTETRAFARLRCTTACHRIYLSLPWRITLLGLNAFEYYQRYEQMQSLLQWDAMWHVPHND